MANNKQPGIALIFGDEIWYIQATDYADVTRKIQTIKDKLVGRGGEFDGVAKQLTSGEYVELTQLESEDIKELLTKGITIRPLGR
ncbi:MAG: hypothetical protein ABJ360_11205 [Roseobacter sp.]